MASILNIISMNHSKRRREELLIAGDERAAEVKALRDQEHDLQRRCAKIEGWEKFEAWYFSDAVPDKTTPEHRIELVREHLKGLVETAGERLGQKWQAYFDADDAGADAALLTKLEKAVAAAGKRYEKAHKAGSHLQAEGK